MGQGTLPRCLHFFLLPNMILGEDRRKKERNITTSHGLYRLFHPVEVGALMGEISVTGFVARFALTWRLVPLDRCGSISLRHFLGHSQYSGVA